MFPCSRTVGKKPEKYDFRDVPLLDGNFINETHIKYGDMIVMAGKRFYMIVMTGNRFYKIVMAS